MPDIGFEQNAVRKRENFVSTVVKTVLLKIYILHSHFKDCNKQVTSIINCIENN